MSSSWQSRLSQMLHLSTGETLRDKALRLEKIYRSLDKETARFKAASGIACLSPCGQCCVNSTVEASELEMLPMAFALVRSGRVEDWYSKAEEVAFAGQCIFYSSKDLTGTCHSYAFRPLVCRLFGYAGNRDKAGRQHLVTCGWIKKKYAQEIEGVFERIVRGEIKIPMTGEVVMRVSSVDPDMAREILPINLAFKKAVDRVMLNTRFRRGWF